MRRLIIPFIQQRDMSECGTTCLAIIFKYYGLPNIQAILRDLADVSNTGVNLYTLSEIAKNFGFISDGLRLEYPHLENIDFPCIAHYEGNHYIVIYKVSPRAVWVVDPAYGKVKLSKTEFIKKWNGIILNLEPTDHLFKSEEIVNLLDSYKKKQNFIKNFYLTILKPFKRILIEVLIASCILQLMGVALPFFTQAILDKVINNKHLELLFAILGGLLGISLLQILLGYARSLLLTHFKIQFEMEFFSKLFHHLIHLSQKYFDSHKKEDFVNRFQENIKIRNLFSSSILQSFINMLFLFNFLVVLFLYNAFLASVSLVFIFLIVTVTVFFTPKLRKLESKIFHKNEKAMGSFLDTLLGIQTVKLMVMEKFKLKKWQNHYQNALIEELNAERTYMMLNFLMGSINIISQITIYWLGALFTFNNALTIGQYVAFISIYGMVMGSINAISGLWFMLMETSVTYEKLNDIFIQEPEISTEFTPGHKIEKPVIEFKSVVFMYNKSSEKATLNGINFKVDYGTKVGIVGRNGSGKSTLVKLLTRMYPYYSGSIMVGDMELKSMHPHDVRKQIYMLPQNIYLFNGTIKENIRISNPDASNEELIRAAKLADVHDFVCSLYMGYNHKVGDSGDNLSSGQRLKIAFARLFLNTPGVIILDEASSVLDSESEKKIFNNINHHFGAATIFIIAHRLQTLKYVDKIITLVDGEIAEEGSHEELILKQGAYYNLMKNYLDF